MKQKRKYVQALIRIVPNGGYVIAKTVSRSMEPIINSRETIMIAKCHINMISTHDIIAFYIPKTETIIAHRVIEKKQINRKTHLLTKGDANQIRDPWPVTNDIYIGKIIGVNGRRWTRVSVLNTHLKHNVKRRIAHLFQLLPLGHRNKKKLG